MIHNFISKYCSCQHAYFVWVGLIMVIFVTIQASCKKEEVDLVPGTFIQVSPEAEATGVFPTPTFTWETSAGAIKYQLIIAKDKEFKQIVQDVQEITTTSFELDQPLALGILFYWKVVASHNKSETEAQNKGISFRVKAGPVIPSPGVSRYYVSPDGEDNPDCGTAEHPFKTLAYAASMVPPSEGDTIMLTEGIFHETMPVVVPVGVNITGAGENVTILSSEGVKIPSNINPENPEYKFWYDGSLIQLVSKHNTIFRKTNSTVIAPENGNQTLSGFTIDGNNKKLKAGIWVENRSNVTLHHVSFRNLDQRGAVFAPGNKEWFKYPSFYMKNIKIHDCKFFNSGKDLADETLGNLNIAQLDSSEIYNIEISDNEGYGIKFIYDGYFKNLKIHDCKFTLNEFDSKWGEDISIELWNLGPGNEINNIECNTWISLVNHPDIFGTPSGTENVKLHNVKVIDRDGTSNKEAVEVAVPGIEIYDSYFENKGFGIAVWDMGRKNITIRNNIFFNTIVHDNWAGGPAIYIDNSRAWEFDNIRIYNNIFEKMRVGIRIKGENIRIIDLKNNVFLNTTVSDIESTAQQVILSNNLKYTAEGTDWTLTGNFHKSTNYTIEPGFLATGTRWGTYYQAASANNIVDKGSDTGLPFSGLAPDIGRWEK